MAAKAKPIPDRFTAITPYLVIRGAAQAIDFYKRAFGAQEVSRMPGPDGKGVMHAELRLGGAMFMLADEMPGGKCRSPQSLGGTSMSIHLYVEDVDATVQQAVAAGATIIMPPSDMFWGDGYGKISDPFGHEWGVATHKRDMTMAEMQKASAEFFAKQPRPSAQ